MRENNGKIHKMMNFRVLKQSNGYSRIKLDYLRLNILNILNSWVSSSEYRTFDL